MIRKIKIIIIILIAIATSALMSNTLFLAGTPYINKPFLAQLMQKPGIFMQNMNDYVASIGKGKEGITEYQQQRVKHYVAEQQTNTQQTTQPTDSNNSSSAENPLPAPRNMNDFEAQGYTKIAKGMYEKHDVSAKVLEIYFTEESKYEKKTMEVGGKMVEVWEPIP